MADGRCETQKKMNLAETRTQLKNEGFYAVRKAVVIVFPVVALLGIIASFLIGMFLFKLSHFNPHCLFSILKCVLSIP